MSRPACPWCHEGMASMIEDDLPEVLHHDEPLGAMVTTWQLIEFAEFCKNCASELAERQGTQRG